MTVKEIKSAIKATKKELKNATGIIAIQLENELETLVYLMEVKKI